VPVFLDGEWWGVLGLSDRRRERPWTPGEERAMKATAAIVGAALWRARTSDELRRSEERLRRTLENSVYALAAMAEQRDPYTAGHQKRVAELSCEIARDLGLPEEKVEGIRIGALVHDVGKIGIPFELLTKPSLLTEVEFAVVRTHPAVGHSVLKTMDFPWAVADIALQHHEHLDGSGYPAGLCGEAICLEARIVRVADVVEAMACHRPYRPALGLGAALEHISRESGVLYDPGAADACLRLFYEKGFRFSDSLVVQEIPPQH
jgi:putative nucleotidyltransferase with HDIG domain